MENIKVKNIRHIIRILNWTFILLNWIEEKTCGKKNSLIFLKFVRNYSPCEIYASNFKITYEVIVPQSQYFLCSLRAILIIVIYFFFSNLKMTWDENHCPRTGSARIYRTIHFWEWKNKKKTENTGFCIGNHTFAMNNGKLVVKIPLKEKVGAKKCTTFFFEDQWPF